MKALREKHLAYVADNLSYFNDCKTSFAISECKSWINKIFNEIGAELEALQSIHEEELKKAYIDGSNSTNELIQSLYKQLEQLKDTKCY